MIAGHPSPMPRHARDYPPGSPVYTYVDANGKNVHIDSKALHDWCQQAGLECVLTPIDCDMAMRFLLDNVVSVERVMALATRQDLTPIIYCMDGQYNNEGRPNVMLVDGHHRYVMMAVRTHQAHEMPLIPAYVLEPAQWEPFVIEGLPNMSQDMLRAAPLGKREY